MKVKINKILPCPFCGGEAEVQKSFDVFPVYRVKHHCELTIVTQWKFKRERAVELWNRRWTDDERRSD